MTSYTHLLFAFSLPTATLYTLALFHHTLPGDQPLLDALRIHHQGWRDFLAWFDINPIASLSMTAFLLALCLIRRAMTDALAVLLILPAQGLIIVLPKLLVGRPRPEGSLMGATDSFPSGTAATAVLVLGLAIYFASLYITPNRLRIPLQGALAAAIIALGIFRILSSEHYPQRRPRRLARRRPLPPSHHRPPPPPAPSGPVHNSPP